MEIKHAIKLPTLGTALDVGRRELVAFIGGGGKSTALVTLARELSSRGFTVVATTTTRMRLSEVQMLGRPMVGEFSRSSVERACRGKGLVVIGRGISVDDKLLGYTAAEVEEVATMAGVDAVLVEADGSAGRPLKAPAEHEPVIPPSASLVVPVIGLSILGQPLDEKTTFRCQRVADLTGCKAGAPLTAAAVATVALHPAGYCKAVPAEARWVVLLNQAELPGASNGGGELARLLLAGGARRVIMGALHHPEAGFKVFC